VFAGFGCGGEGVGEFWGGGVVVDGQADGEVGSGLGQQPLEQGRLLGGVRVGMGDRQDVTEPQAVAGLVMPVTRLGV